MELTVKDDLLENFTEDAKRRLRELTLAHTEELIKEALLLEEGDRADGAKIEITSNIITKAAIVKRTVGIEKKAPKWVKICKIVSVVSCSVSGFFFDSEGFSDNSAKLIAFVITFAIACISTALMFIKE